LKFFYCISLSLFHLFPFLFHSFYVFTFFLFMFVSCFNFFLFLICLSSFFIIIMRLFIYFVSIFFYKKNLVFLICFINKILRKKLFLFLFY
jgi:hypothetical protein